MHPIMLRCSFMPKPSLRPLQGSIKGTAIFEFETGSISSGHDDDTNAWIAHRFIVTILKQAHPNESALPHTFIPIVFTTEWPSNHGRVAVSADASRRLD